VKHLAEDLGLGFGLHYVHIQGMPGMAIYGYSTSKLEIQVIQVPNYWNILGPVGIQ